MPYPGSPAPAALLAQDPAAPPAASQMGQGLPVTQLETAVTPTVQIATQATPATTPQQQGATPAVAPPTQAEVLQPAVSLTTALLLESSENPALRNFLDARQIMQLEAFATSQIPGNAIKPVGISFGRTLTTEVSGKHKKLGWKKFQKKLTSLFGYITLMYQFVCQQTNEAGKVVRSSSYNSKEIHEDLDFPIATLGNFKVSETTRKTNHMNKEKSVLDRTGFTSSFEPPANWEFLNVYSNGFILRNELRTKFSSTKLNLTEFLIKSRNNMNLTYLHDKVARAMQARQIVEHLENATMVVPEKIVFPTWEIIEVSKDPNILNQFIISGMGTEGYIVLGKSKKSILEAIYFAVHPCPCYAQVNGVPQNNSFFGSSQTPNKILIYTDDESEVQSLINTFSWDYFLIQSRVNNVYTTLGKFCGGKLWEQEMKAATSRIMLENVLEDQNQGKIQAIEYNLPAAFGLFNYYDETKTNYLFPKKHLENQSFCDTIKESIDFLSWLHRLYLNALQNQTLEELVSNSAYVSLNMQGIVNNFTARNSNQSQAFEFFNHITNAGNCYFGTQYSKSLICLIKNSFKVRLNQTGEVFTLFCNFPKSLYVNISLEGMCIENTVSAVMHGKIPLKFSENKGQLTIDSPLTREYLLNYGTANATTSIKTIKNNDPYFLSFKFNGFTNVLPAYLWQGRSDESVRVVVNFGGVILNYVKDIATPIYIDIPSESLIEGINLGFDHLDSDSDGEEGTPPSSPDVPPPAS